MLFMRPGRSVIEIGYKGQKSMRFPATYFMSIAMSLRLKYFLTMAEGNYGWFLSADIPDVLLLAQGAVRNTTLLPQGALGDHRLHLTKREGARPVINVSRAGASTIATGPTPFPGESLGVQHARRS